jgi:hypothetical protein
MYINVYKMYIKYACNSLVSFKHIYNEYYKPLHMFRQTFAIFRGFIAKVYKKFVSIYMLKISKY